MITSEKNLYYFTVYLTGNGSRAEAAERLRAAYGEKFDFELLRTSRQEVSGLLGDKLPIRSLKERLHPRQQEQMTTKQKRKQRDQER